MAESNDVRDLEKKLATPFEQIKWRARQVIQSKKNQKWYGIMIAYIDARDVVSRLNEAVGSAGWSFSWDEIPVGDLSFVQPAQVNTYDANKSTPEKNVTKQNYVVKGKLTLLGTTKEDVGYPNSERDDDEQKLKSAVSDALKRCAVQFGIGSFLYDLDQKLIEYDGPSPKGKPVRPEDLEKLESMFKTNRTVASK